MSDAKKGTFVVDNVARTALNGILGKSIEERSEYGAMIYLLNGRYAATLPRTQGDPNRVNVGQNEPNCGCPRGSKPVAYYHTHPTFSIGGMTGDYNHFSPEDIDVVTDHDLEAAYLGTLDGSFLRYDAKTGKTTVLSGRLKNTT